MTDREMEESKAMRISSSNHSCSCGSANSILHGIPNPSVAGPLPVISTRILEQPGVLLTSEGVKVDQLGPLLQPIIPVSRVGGTSFKRSRVALPATMTIKLEHSDSKYKARPRITVHHVLIDVSPHTNRSAMSDIREVRIADPCLNTFRRDMIEPSCAHAAPMFSFTTCRLFFAGQVVYFGGHLPVPSGNIHELKLSQPVALGLLEPGSYLLKVSIAIPGLSLTLKLHNNLIGIAPIGCDPNLILDQSDSERNYEDKNDTNIAGLLFLPKDIASFKGTVLLANGQTGSFPQKDAFKTVWSYILPCLAANGFIAAAIRSTVSIAMRVSQLKGNIKFLANKIKAEHKIDIVSKPLALVGASEAGVSTAIVANDMTGLPFSECRAVIGLGTTHDPSLYGKSLTKNFLALHGTHDGEVLDDQGGRMFDHLTGAQFRCHIWIHGATHHGFSNTVAADVQIANTGLFPKVDTRIAKATQLIVAKNYIVMFLLWRLGGQNIFEPLFLGDALLNVTADSTSDDQVKKDVESGRLQMLPRYRRFSEDPKTQPLCPTGDCYSFDDFLVGLEESAKFPFKPLNSFSSKIVCPNSGFSVRWVLSIRPNPKITIIPALGIVALVPLVFELDLVHFGFAMNGSASARFKVVIHTSDGKIRTQDNFFVPKSLNIFTFDPFTLKMNVNESRFVPSVIRIHFGSFGMASGDIEKITKAELDFTSSNAIGMIVLTGVRFAFV